MLITGNEIPSWFAPQKSSSFAEIPFPHPCPPTSFAEIPFPHPCPPTEWLGFAVCFLLVADRPLVYGDTEIACYKIMKQDKDDWRAESPVITRNVPLLEPKLPHLYILFLSIGEYPERMHTGYGFRLMRCPDCGPLKIVQAGCRLVCKEDLQDIYRNHSHTSSVGPNNE
ncbi:uncharacterized protein LOC130960999 [Arachis stenosperma]|uniref:uncharacterized protein LOC130960999 n=1 Tax=Arachis stenosperma TaxID=217475 RepID=UPI0025ACD133|nr:uncharacterized protein LOC130960999 [Arachis stenosperma]